MTSRKSGTRKTKLKNKYPLAGTGAVESRVSRDVRIGRGRPTLHPASPKSDGCDKLLAMLSEYVDGGLKPCLCKQIESHLDDCSPCRVVVDNVRKTIMLYRGTEPCEMPESVSKRLHECLRAKWKSPARRRK